MLIKVLLLLTAHWKCALAVIFIDIVADDIEICVHFVSCCQQFAFVSNMHKSTYMQQQQHQQQQLTNNWLLHLCVLCVGVSRSYNDSAAAKYNGCRRRCRYVSYVVLLPLLLLFSFLVTLVTRFLAFFFFVLCGQFTKCTFFTPFTHTHAFSHSYNEGARALPSCRPFLLLALFYFFLFCTHYPTPIQIDVVGSGCCCFCCSWLLYIF